MSLFTFGLRRRRFAPPPHSKARAYVVLGVSLLLLSIQAKAGELRRIDDFGRNWIMCHPFTLMALSIRGTEVADSKYVDAGFNTMLAWKANPGLFENAVKYGLPWHQHTRKNPLTDALKERISKHIGLFDGGQGVLIWDEPARRDIPEVAQVIDWVKQTYPEQLVYSNADPGNPEQTDDRPYSYDNYLRDLVDAGVDVLMIDIYPFRPDGVFQQNYWERIGAVRRVARAANIPYWAFIQAFEARNNWRKPSESDLRMQVFSSLAYGFTGIAYFMFDHAYDGALLYSEDEESGLGGVPTPLYYDVKRLNTELSNIGPCLRYLTSTGVWIVPGQHIVGDHLVENPVSPDIEKFTSANRIGLIESVRVKGSRKDANILIGLFEDPIGDPYAMIVNLSHGADVRAAERMITVELHLSPALSSIGRLSRDSGRGELLTVRDGVLELTLRGGTGDLLKLAPDTVFAGTAVTPAFQGTTRD